MLGVFFTKSIVVGITLFFCGAGALKLKPLNADPSDRCSEERILGTWSFVSFVGCPEVFHIQSCASPTQSASILTFEKEDISAPGFKPGILVDDVVEFSAPHKRLRKIISAPEKKDISAPIQKAGLEHDVGEFSTHKALRQNLSAPLVPVLEDDLEFSRHKLLSSQFQEEFEHGWVARIPNHSSVYLQLRCSDDPEHDMLDYWFFNTRKGSLSRGLNLGLQLEAAPWIPRFKRASRSGPVGVEHTQYFCEGSKDVTLVGDDEGETHIGGNLQNGHHIWEFFVHRSKGEKFKDRLEPLEVQATNLDDLRSLTGIFDKIKADVIDKMHSPPEYRKLVNFRECDITSEDIFARRGDDPSGPIRKLSSKSAVDVQCNLFTK